jgi:hypothetical protein
MPTFTVEQVRAARVFLGWTQVDLGEAAGVSFETIRTDETSSFPLSPESHAAVTQGIQESWRRISKERQADRRHDSRPSTTPVGLMNGEQSRLLKIGDRVQWDNSLTDRGTVTHNAWGGVVINWDDGRTSSIHHNDMAHIERVPKV